MFRLNRRIGVLTVLLCASVALAQRPGGAGGPGGGPRGGFGFGGPGGPKSPLMLVAYYESVQKELALKDDQIAKIKALGEESRKEMQPLFGGGVGERRKDESDAEREKRTEEMRAKFAAATKKVNETILPKLNETLDHMQRERLQQIRLQDWGSQALLDPDVAKSLNLSKDDTDKLAAISKEFREKLSALSQRSGGGGDRGDFQERFAKMVELNESRDKQLTEVLTAEQREQWEKLKGKPFDVAQLRGGFGRPGVGNGANPDGRPQRRPSTDEKKSDENEEGQVN